jgi:DNA-binding CsgD family transcriptional regulator/tetratricopeptide (TPR) repeat protein
VSFAEAALTAREAVRDGAGVGYARDAVFAVALSFAYEAAGRLDDALALAQLGHRMSLDQGELQGQAWFSLVIGDVMQARGEPELAESWFGEAASAFGQARRPAARWAWAGAATAASSSGDIERALAHLGRIDAAGPSGWRFLDPLIDRARAWVASLAGDDAGALGHLDRGVRTSRDAGMAWLEAFLLIDVVCFDPVLGASTTGRLDELAEVVCDPRVGIWARAASALVGRDVSAIETGADELGRLGLRLDAGDLLAIAATRSWPTDVAVATRLATAARRASGAPGLVTPASRRLATVPGLSPRVLQVADLAAGGASSREIAERLTIGVRTVDNQLGRVFRTFGISSRHELRPFIDAWYGPVDGRPHRH